ncbi:hypothetical protein O6H91_02G133600 [Diphasiastrum complanatum]|nr:hypothetical protein O6H91_02G133600 [Diphasiastrum complanatum]
MDKIGQGQKFSFLISAGDNFYENGLSGIEDPLFEESFSNVYTGENLQKPWFAVLGNHDYHGDVLAQLDSALVLRDSRWHCGREYQLLHQLESSAHGGSYVEFFFIDTVPFVDEYWQTYHKPMDWRGLLPREEHLVQKLQVLSKALESSVATWKIVVGHHPIYSEGSHGDTVELIERLLPILNTQKADLYVNGHDHCLEHIKREDSSINFITSGGGSKAWKGMKPTPNKNGVKLYYDGQGFTTFTVTSTHLHISYFDVYGSVIHEVDLYK